MIIDVMKCKGGVILCKEQEWVIGGVDMGWCNAQGKTIEWRESIIRWWDNGTKKWYLNGDLHREDGPAVEWADGTKEWYIEGIKLTEEEFNDR